MDHVTLIATTIPPKDRAILVLPVAREVLDDPALHPVIRERLLRELTRQIDDRGSSDDRWSLEWFRGDGWIDPATAFQMGQELRPLTW
jgi:hypothetical protein